MSRICEICGKGPTFGITKSHSNIKTRRRVFPNIQITTQNQRRVKICTSCLKSRSKQK